MLLFFGVCGLLLGSFFSFFALRQFRRASSIHRALSSTPTTPIAGTPPVGVVKIEGTVVPSEQGLVVSHASGGQAVYYRISVSTPGSPHPHVHTASDRRDFWLQDPSGAHARIPSEGATVVARHTRFTVSGRSLRYMSSAIPQDCLGYQPFSASLHGWLTSFTAVDDGLLVEEEIIMPGERVLALGFASRADDGTLFLTPLPVLGLVVSTLSEQELRERHRDESRLAFGFLLAGIAFLVIGTALSAWGLFVW